jgi:hypothetical protein
MEMRIMKTTQSFADTIQLEPVIGRMLQNIVSTSHRHKVLQLQRTFEEKRHEWEPNYLPPTYHLDFEEARVIESVGFGQKQIGHVRPDHQDILVFEGSDGTYRAFHASFSLLKKDTIYFIFLILEKPASPVSHMENTENQDAAISSFDCAEETPSIESIHRKVGSLAVRVERARNLPNIVAPRSQKAYCKLTFDKVDKQTRSDLLGGGTLFWYEPWID